MNKISHNYQLPKHDYGPVIDRTHPLWDEYEKLVRLLRGRLKQAPTFLSFFWMQSQRR